MSNYHIEHQLTLGVRTFTVSDSTGLIWTSKSKVLDSNTYIFNNNAPDTPQYTVERHYSGNGYKFTVLSQTNQAVANITYSMFRLFTKYAWQITDTNGTVLAAAKAQGSFLKLLLTVINIPRQLTYNLYVVGQSVCVLSEQTKGFSNYSTMDVNFTTEQLPFNKDIALIAAILILYRDHQSKGKR